MTKEGIYHECKRNSIFSADIYVYYDKGDREKDSREKEHRRYRCSI